MTAKKTGVHKNMFIIEESMVPHIWEAQMRHKIAHYCNMQREDCYFKMESATLAFEMVPWIIFLCHFLNTQKKRAVWYHCGLDLIHKTKLFDSVNNLKFAEAP